MEHDWPDSPMEHLWGDWVQQLRTDNPGGATQYRSCIHPKCKAFETRPAPRG